MAKLFFHLRDVPEDEADDVRAILEQNHIPFFETFAGSWGISTPAIWLCDEADENAARIIMDAYQHRRAIEQRARYEEAKKAGHHAGFWAHNLRHPLRFFMHAVILVMILYLSTIWVLKLTD